MAAEQRLVYVLTDVYQSGKGHFRSHDPKWPERRLIYVLILCTSVSRLFYVGQICILVEPRLLRVLIYVSVTVKRLRWKHNISLIVGQRLIFVLQLSIAAER